MIRFLPFAVEFALLVFCLVDRVQADSGRIRNLGKATWAFLVGLLPLVGGIAWLVAGRPEGPAPRGRCSPGSPEHERPDGPTPSQVDRRVREEQARVDAEFDAAVRRAKARRPSPGA
ncbi:PLD nuclease N-terminal domain-containing protein [Kineococcus rhizosphaerae]|uniref:Phospholipase D-like protein n=1 Tax=Kineococcus rhizosphaerae TaxID=559628 RepID=A0A2T0R8H1_9ACTN|nr:PLD nuclease N-terminal domain-containing protein [Kineococcus rhizosphaerae]PRY17430.1 phospholipase D-like protein [Kineococcus rhizosphaerae]